MIILRTCLFLFFYLAASGGLRAFEIPALSSPVIDAAGVLSGPVEQELRHQLIDIHQRGGPQLQVLTLPTLDGMSIEQASIAVVDKWKLGDKTRDDGVLLLVAPSERKVRIEVGQGLEGSLPDVIAARIIREIIVPQFKANNFDGGVVMGVQYILQSVWPQSDGLHIEKLAAKTKTRSFSKGKVILINIVIILLIIFLNIGRRRRGFLGSGYSGYGGHGSSWGGGGFGSGGGWGGGGGGFSGGGSSGSW